MRVSCFALTFVTLGIDPWQTLLARSLRFEELTLTAPQIQWPERAGAEGRNCLKMCAVR